MTRARIPSPGARRVARAVGAATLAALLVAEAAWATPPASSSRPGIAPRAAFPAGPTPRNPAGPTPRNPAGPPPLNAAGSFGAAPRMVHRPPLGSASDPLFVPQPFVSVVGPAAAPAFLGGSFFCEVHNRGFATEQFFFDHVEGMDGVPADVAAEMLIDGGGVWVFTGE
jgi:hypothetical protein